MPDFKPSEVRLWRAFLPLIATFGNSKTEFGAALMVLGCRHFGNEWQPLSRPQLADVLKREAEKGGSMHHLRTNPFLPHPDLDRLVRDGYATWLGDPDEPGTPIRFTDKGFEILRRTIPQPPP